MALTHLENRPTLLGRPADGAVPDLRVTGVTPCCRVVVLIPAYNEENYIGSVVLRAQKYSDTVIVVDDGSVDTTADVARAAGADVVVHPENRGKGAALNTGFRRAREFNPEVVITLDADGQHIPEQLTTVIGPVLAGEADIVVGSRYIENNSNVPRNRVLGHQFFNSVTGHLSGVPVSDSQSGFRAFSARALACISFSSSGFTAESEMQFLAHEHGLRVREVPITITYHGKPKRSVIGQGLTVLTGILRLVGQHRPLLFVGVPGVSLSVLGLLIAVRIVEMYGVTGVLPLGTTLLSILLISLGAMGFFTGIILHSVRGLLIQLLRTRS